MGGYGSGRWQYRYKARPIAETSFAWPIRNLHKGISYVLHNGGAWGGRTSWKVGTYKEGSVSYTIYTVASGIAVKLSYTWNRIPIEDTIMLVATASNLPGNKGQRWWWRCPGCKRRVGVLYAPGKLWRCRHCYKITYTSSNESDKRISAMLRPNSVALSLPFMGDPSKDTRRSLNIILSGITLMMKAQRKEEKRLDRYMKRLKGKKRG